MADKNSNKLTAEVRHSFGKGAARKLRALNKIPVVLYGHGTEPQHLALPGHETALLLRKANAVIDLDIEGTSQVALVKDVQKDPVKQIIEHIDLVVIRLGEKVIVDVPVHLEGEPFAGTIANLDANTLSLEASAIAIPERVIVNIEGLEEGAQILAGDVELPEGSTLVTEADVLVVGIVVPQEETEDDDTAAEGETAEDAESSAEDAN